MNIISILWKLGYDVLSFNEAGEYKIMFGHDRQKRQGFSQETYIVKACGVSFNGFGNLFVSFDDVETGECVDCFEFGNMGPEELYN